MLATEFEKPQVSVPNIGIPDIWKRNACEMDRNMAPHLDSLSPPQWPTYWPLPANVLLTMMKGRRPGKTESEIPRYAALAIPMLHKLCTSYSVVLY